MRNLSSEYVPQALRGKATRRLRIPGASATQDAGNVGHRWGRGRMGAGDSGEGSGRCESVIGTDETGAARAAGPLLHVGLCSFVTLTRPRAWRQAATCNRNRKGIVMKWMTYQTVTGQQEREHVNHRITSGLRREPRSGPRPERQKTRTQPGCPRRATAHATAQRAQGRRTVSIRVALGQHSDRARTTIGSEDTLSRVTASPSASLVQPHAHSHAGPPSRSPRTGRRALPTTTRGAFLSRPGLWSRRRLGSWLRWRLGRRRRRGRRLGSGWWTRRGLWPRWRRRRWLGRRWRARRWLWRRWRRGRRFGPRRRCRPSR